jgi:hypothetical protein
MKLCDKFNKIYELKGFCLLALKSVDEYIEFMEGTYPEVVLRKMWGRFGAETCVSVINDTVEGCLSRILKPRGFYPPEAPTVSIDFVKNFPLDILPKYTRGDRVLVKKENRGYLKGIVYGAKADKSLLGWQYSIKLPGNPGAFKSYEVDLLIDADHPASQPPEDFVNNGRAKIREPLKPKKSKTR